MGYSSNDEEDEAWDKVGTSGGGRGELRSRPDDEPEGTRTWMNLRSGRRKGNNIITSDDDEEDEEYTPKQGVTSLVGDEYGESEEEVGSEAERENERLDKEIAELSPRRRQFVERIMNPSFLADTTGVDDEDEIPGSPEEFARNYARYHGNTVCELSNGINR